MNAKKLVIILATIGIVYWAWQVSKTNAPTVDLSNEALYPDLLDQVNEIDKVLIRSSGAATELKRSGENWTVGNRDDFPAKFDSVKSTILKIAETTVIERKTARADKYATLGVNDPESTEDAKGVRVDITNTKGKELVSLVIGNERQGRALGEANYYIRRVADEASYLVAGELDISAQVDDWIDADIADIDTERVRRITITPHAEDPVVIAKEKPSDNFFSVQNVPAGFKAKSRATVSSLGALLLSLRFEDVVSATHVASSTPRGQVEAQTFDGLVALFERYDYQDNEYVKISFRYDESAVAEQSTFGEETAETELPKSVPAEADSLNAKTSGWLYKLPDFKMRMLDKRLSDLIEPEEDEEPATEPASDDS